MFRPFGFVPSWYTFAPRDLNNKGPDLYAAPLAQSIAILIPFKVKADGKFFLKF